MSVVWSHGEEDRKRFPHCPHILNAPKGTIIFKDEQTGQMVCDPCAARLNAIGLFPRTERLN